jgi:hypothetical protein
MKALLIDGAGTIVADADALIGRFASPYALNNLSEYAVTVLGFVAVDRFGTTCQMRFCPARLSDATLDTTLRLLIGERATRFVLAEPSDNWRYRVYADAHHAARALLDRVEREPQRRPLGERLETKIAPEHVLRADIRALVQSWSNLRRTRDDDLMRREAQRVLSNRFAVVAARTDRAELMFSEIGDGFANYDAPWRNAAIGRDFAAQPDRAYGDWVSRAYDEAMSDGGPRVYDVDAFIDTPSAGRTRMRFKRVLLPAMNARGDKIIIGGSVMDDQVDLRAGERTSLAHTHKAIDIFEPARRGPEQRSRAIVG